MKTIKIYRPKTQSFPFLTIKYLKEHGESKNKDIRFAIGLDDWSKKSIYTDRSSYHFDILTRRLINKKLIKRTKHGYYNLTK